MSNRNRLLVGLMSVALGITLAGCSTTTAPASDGDIASVNGKKIPRSDFLNKIESSQQAKSILNQLVQSALITQYAKDNNLDVPDADVAKKEDEIKARYPAGQFEVLLKNQNLTEDDVKKILREQLLVEKAVGKDIHVSDADVKAYLAKNHATLDKPAQVHARHILVADLKTAQEVEAKLKSGAKFEDVAKQYSTDPGSKDKGGDLGFFGKGQMTPSFQDAAFSQKIGVVGPPVKSPFGYHVIEVLEKKPATVATMANSGTAVREQLFQQQEQPLIPVFLQGLKSKATIEIYDPMLKDAVPQAPPAAPPAATAAAAPTTGH